MNYINCFADGKTCKALVDIKCKGCKFYKTVEQVAQERRRTRDRLYGLRRYDLIRKYRPDELLVEDDG